MSLKVQIVPALSDNYIYILMTEAEAGGKPAVGVVDPGDAGAVIKALDHRGLVPTDILITHHHNDHTAGAHALKERYGARITGPQAEHGRLPELDRMVSEGDTVQLGPVSAHVLETPGHTAGHISYWFEDGKALFCGDTMFAMGCGRLFEGSPEQMWESLKKLRALPEDTQVYCGHEYTLNNARFARAIDPDNKALADRMRVVEGMRSRGLATIPSTIGDERLTNPFLRADAPELQKHLDMTGKSAAEVFAEIRRRKDAA